MNDDLVVTGQGYKEHVNICYLGAGHDFLVSGRDDDGEPDLRHDLREIDL